MHDTANQRTDWSGISAHLSPPCPGIALGPGHLGGPSSAYTGDPFAHAPYARRAPPAAQPRCPHRGEACHLPVLWPRPRAGNPGGTGGVGGTAGPRAGPVPPAAAARGSGSGTGVAGAVEGPTGQVDRQMGEGNDGQREDVRTDGQKGEKNGGGEGGAGEPWTPCTGPSPGGQSAGSGVVSRPSPLSGGPCL